MSFWAAGAVVVGAGISAASASRNAKAQRKAQEEAIAGLGTDIAPFTFIGPGNQFAGFGTRGNAQQRFGGTAAPVDFAALAGLGSSAAPQARPGLNLRGQGGGQFRLGGGGLLQNAPGVQAGGPGGQVPGRQFVGGSSASIGPEAPTSATGFTQIPGATRGGGPVFANEAGEVFDQFGQKFFTADAGAAGDQGQRIPGVEFIDSKGRNNPLFFGAGGNFFSRDQDLGSLPTADNPGQSSPFSVGGVGSDDPTVFSSLGDLEGSRQGLVALAQQSIGRAGLSGGLPQDVQRANLQNQLSIGALGASTDQLQGLGLGANIVAGSNLAGFLGAQEQFGNIDPQAVADQRLALLREQAAPFEERAFSDLQENLFSTGRLGTTGGGLQTEAFARGLGQADLQRQLSASAEGRATQQLGESLLQGAFGRFGQSAGLARDINQQGFGQRLAQSGLFQSNLENQIGLSSLGQTLRGNELSLGLQALQGQGALNTQGLNNFQAALAAAQARANAQVGAGSNIAQIASGSNFGAGSNVGSTFGAALANNAGAFGNALGNVFGGAGGASGAGGANAAPAGVILNTQLAGIN